ncbi:type II secretion system secretin GspD [Poriferisphaera sp. WC338]|uniref:type II secretion system secretin GspD n=1 Tax=Poriferisphaera sp. WC338 TaxID=3425129 RepID=UPI003D81644E
MKSCSVTLSLMCGAMGFVQVDARAEAVTPLVQTYGVIQPSVLGAIGDDLSIKLHFDEVPIDTVLEYISEKVGYIVIKEVPVEGVISIVSKQPVNRDEMIQLLNTVLKQHGLAAIQNERILTVVQLANAKKHNIPVMYGSDPKEISSAGHMITQVIPIANIDATKLLEDIQPLIQDHAQLTANENSNAIILTDTSNNVRRIAQIIEALDRHVSTIVDVRVFPLDYAEADSTADLINEIFEEDQQSNQQSQNPFARFMMARGRGGRGGPSAAPAAESSNRSAPSREIKAAADERTNTVVVSGPSEVLDTIASLIEELDADPAATQSVFIYDLKNADAETLAESLNELFADVEESAVRTAANNQRNNRQGGRQQPQPTRTTSSSDTGNSSDLAGEVTIVADTETNSLMVLTSTSNFDRVKEIIEKLDRPVQQVLIKVLIAEVTHDNSLDLGVEFSSFNLRGDQGWSVGTDFGLSNLTDGISFSLMESNLDVAVKALEQEGKLDVLSRPYILTSDNQTASITVGEEVPFVRDSRITDTGQTINTVTYEDVGIILEVTPQVNAEGLVVMDVLPEISVQSEDSVEITDGVNAPKISKRSAETRVAIKDGQTIVIGGLVQDRVNERVSKVPLLGDIPLLGELFKSRSNEKVKTELLIFLTPYVAIEPDELSEISAMELDDYRTPSRSTHPELFKEHFKNMNIDMMELEVE